MDRADRAGVHQRTEQMRYLIRDRAGQFTDAFNAVFAAKGIEVLRNAPQCPRMNAYAERVVRTIRSEPTERSTCAPHATTRTSSPSWHTGSSANRYSKG